MRTTKYLITLTSVFFLYTTSWASSPPDTIKIGNTAQSGSGGHIIGDQQPVIVIAPDNAKLHSMNIYFSTVAKTDSLRFYAKSNPSWSCSGIGGMSNPLSSDQYTLGISQNTLVSPNSWNEFTFDPPITTSDTIFLWPDLLQMIQPRVEFAASGFEDSLLYANCVFSSLAQNDYRCEFTFIEDQTCADIQNITDDVDAVIIGDTISSTAIIGNTKNILYDAGIEVRLLSPFEVELGGILQVNISGCN